jgi:hypothetical protein
MKHSNEHLKILSQHVDTLVLGFYLTESNDFHTSYQTLIRHLQDLKKEAQNSNDDLGSKFVKTDLLQGTTFKVSSRGGRNGYGYYLENDSILMWIGDFKEESEKPHIVVRFRASYLFQRGAKGCHDDVTKFLSNLIGSTKTKVLEFHLATDVWGVEYTYFDGLRFQSNYTRHGFVETDTMRNFGTSNKISGFSFGSGDFMFRIYDKTKKIKNSPSEGYIKHAWNYNGYMEEFGLSVYRHEVQYRRAELVKFMPENIEDEFKWFLKNMNLYWFNAVNKIQFVPLNTHELERIECISKSDTRRQIFYRAKKDRTRFHFWELLKQWKHDRVWKIPQVHKTVTEAKLKTAQKFIKAYVGAVYKATGGVPENLSSTMLIAEKDLRLHKSIGLHDYGLIKVASDFVRSHKIVSKLGIAPDTDYASVAKKHINDFRDLASRINNPKYLSMLNYALEAL